MLSRFVCLLTVLVWLLSAWVTPLYAQQKKEASVPLEFSPTDPAVREILGPTDRTCTAESPARIRERIEKALVLATNKNLVNDQAVLEAWLGSRKIAEAKLDDGFALLQKALDDSVQASNEVLHADILATLATQFEMRGDLDQAIALAGQALDLSNRTGNMYGKARALGELGRLRLGKGQNAEARAAVEQALEIDRINGYALEAVHLRSQGAYLGIVGKRAEAIRSMEEARAKAISFEDPLTFLVAENGLAYGLARDGQREEAVRQLSLLRNGQLEEFITEPSERSCFEAYLEQPIAHVIALEGYANVLAGAQQQDKELQAWEELFVQGRELKLPVVEAEAKQKRAQIESRRNKKAEALEDDREAEVLYRQLHNESALDQTEVAEASLLIDLGRGAEAVPVIERISAYARQNHLRELEYKSFITLSNIYRAANDLTKTRVALEQARSLVSPGPGDRELTYVSIHALYASLSDVYRKQHIPAEELIAIEDAFMVAFDAKDEKEKQEAFNYFNQRLDELHVRDLVEQKQKEGALRESLIYSYLLYFHDGIGDAAKNPNWERILTLPFQMTQQPEGAAQLATVLDELRPLLGFEKHSMLVALSRYYITTGANPQLAEKYALESEELLAQNTGDVRVLRIESTCTLALARARQSKREPAQKGIRECLVLAEQVQTEQSKLYADAFNTMVQAQFGNFAASQPALEKLAANSPDNPELLVEVAEALASARRYDEMDHKLSVAVGKYLANGDQRSAASAYLRPLNIVTKDPSPAAKKIHLKYLNAALKLYTEAHASKEQAETSIALGDYFLAESRPAEAIPAYDEAQRLAQQIDQKDVLGQALLGLGNAAEQSRNYRKAEEFHRRAGDLFSEQHSVLGQSMCLRALGIDYYNLGATDKALAAYQGARKLAEGAGPLQVYFSANALGNFYRSQADYEKALAAFADAKRIAETSDDVEHVAYTHLAIGEVDGLVGRWDDSLQEIHQALAGFVSIHDEEGQASSWAELTAIYSDRTSPLKDFDEAQECYKKALALGADKSIEVDLLEIYIATGKTTEAIRIARQSADDCRKKADVFCEAHALITLSEAQRMAGDPKASRQTMNEATKLVRNSSDFYLHGRLAYQESRLLASEGRLSEALASYKMLIAMIEDIKGKLSPREQQSLSENYGFIYDEVISLCYDLSERSPAERVRFASEGLELAEKNKARQFAETWGQVFKNQMAEALPAGLRERETILDAQRNRLLSELKDARDSNVPAEQTAELQAELKNTEVQIHGFVEDLRRVSPQYAAIAYPEDVRLSALPLEKTETFVEFKVTADATFVWLLRKSDDTTIQLVSFYKVPQTRAWLLENLKSIRDALNSARPDAVRWERSEEVFGALFPRDVVRVLHDSQQVVFVPDDVLFVLPFELLSPKATKGEFPLLREPTSYFPSAATFELARKARRPSEWRETFLGIADPVTSPEDERYQGHGTQEALDPKRAETEVASVPTESSVTQKLTARGYSFERLRGTADEVNGIASMLRAHNQSVEVRLGSDATKRELLDTDLSRFRFVHFATHGVLPVDTNIREPSLVLSIDDVGPSHMFLSMSEILGLKLRSESVVLSACNTGSGQISRAEGVMSLGRAFLAAGSKSVTVSLWQVSDDSTAWLMETYYQGILANKKKNAALADARYAVFSSGATNPYYWAPFIVIGE